MKSKWLSFLCFTFAILPMAGFSGEAEATLWQTKKAKVASQRPLKVSDSKIWNRARGFQVSKDGKWAAFVQEPGEGDGTVYVKEVKGKKKYEFKVGPRSGSISFSDNGQWLAFVQRPGFAAAKAARKAKKPLPSKVQLIALKDGSKTTFDNAAGFSFSGESSSHLAIPLSKSPSAGSTKGNTVLLYSLKSKQRVTLGNVGSFRFNKAGTHLAYTIDSPDKASNGLFLFSTKDLSIHPVDGGSFSYGDLSWTKEGDVLSVAKGTKDKKFKKENKTILAILRPTGKDAKKIEVDARNIACIPSDMGISNGRINWDKKRSRFVFSITNLEEIKSKASKDPKAKPEPKVDQAGVVIWHWKDKRLQSAQQRQAGRDKNVQYECVYLVDSKKTFRITDKEIPQARISEPYKFAIGYDDDAYKLQSSLDGKRFTDIYSIRLKDGKRKLILEKMRWVFGVNPTGSHLLYYQDKHFFTYNLTNGKKTNITKDSPVSFIDVEDDHNVKNPPSRSLGWTSDGQYVLLSDGWDVWKVSVSGGKPINLTKNGKTDQIRYRRFYQLDPDARGFDLSKPTFMPLYSEWTKESGIGRLKDDGSGVEKLIWEKSAITGLSKLKDKDVYWFRKESNSQSPNYFVAEGNLKSPKKMTDTNSQQKNFKWSAGVKLIDYTSTNGDKLQGTLHLPAGYIEGKKYPTVVYIYEKLSQRTYSYSGPRTGGFSPAIYTSNGYAVFMPDLVYKVNDPGVSSKACLIPAVDAAIKSGIVDPKKIGLHGHSWGGYQTAFMITQSDKFAAAVAGAPLTNMISMYSLIYWNSGSANQPIFESSQGRFTGSYLTQPEAYRRNSPVLFAQNVKTPLLLLHNDKDGAVDFTQGVEYYNTLRRLGKPVVMLQYKGENHGLVKEPNRIDYSHRMLGFFDHHLKGKSAPKWWSKGIKHLDHKEHIKDFEKTNRKN